MLSHGSTKYNILLSQNIIFITWFNTNETFEKKNDCMKFN